MSMNTTPKGERIHIALFGRRNAGKSSLINAITGQDLAIVSDVLGTTTDPVYKAMEILPLGPVMLIDTPGLDDEGVLGEERIKKARSVLNKTDLALIVADGNEAAKDFSFEHQILALTKKKNIPSIVVLNKQDLWAGNEAAIQAYGDLCVSSKTGYHIHELKELMTTKLPTDDQTGKIVGDLLSPLDSATAAGNSRCAGIRCDRYCMPGYRTCGHFKKTRSVAKTCHYGLPGICKCIKRHAKKHSSYFFLDSFFPL